MAKRSTGKKSVEIKTIYGSHLAVLEPDERGFVVTVPALPGVISWGKNLNHAKEMAKEAIELCVECLVEEKQSKRSKSSRKIPVRASA